MPRGKIMQLPQMLDVRQKVRSAPMEDPRGALRAELRRVGLETRLGNARRVAVAVGSRDIDGLVPVLEVLVSALKESGCEPFIVPAMGSHGGATPDGQELAISRLGVSEKSVGAPVRSSMETADIGVTASGAGVFIDRLALEADAIVAVNRVAPHTGFSGPIQSGLLKMLAVGLGKQDGARSLHSFGFGAPHVIGEMADVVIGRSRVAMCIALVEDGAGRLSILEALEPRQVGTREPELLKAACDMHPRIPVAEVDVLIVEEMGKDHSGVGMDPLVTGRGKEFPGGETPFEASRLVVLSLSAASGGNATGIGHADITTERLVASIDRKTTYRNVLTSGALYRARIPLVAESDRRAVEMALESLPDLTPETARVVRIKNTRRLEQMQVSTALAEEISSSKGVSLAGEPAEIQFDADGNLV